MRHQVKAVSNANKRETVRSPARTLSELGSGTIIAIGLIFTFLGMTLLFLNLSNRFIEQARLNALADNAAVAGADVLRGLVAGYPCEVARSQAPVTRCEIIGNDVLIEVGQAGLRARARAGEPG